MARKFVVETFGCQMNYHDSERITGLLEADGYEAAVDETEAELVVLNTCSIREKAVGKVRSRLGQIMDAARERGDKPPMVAVTGCVAQQEGDKLFAGGTPIDVVAGTQAVKQLPRLLAEARETRKQRFDVNPYEDVSFPLGLAHHADPVRASVTIIEGCNEFCAFCVVPYTRGHERMRPVRDILAEARRAADTGHVEIQLLGQIVNHYEAPDDNCDFAQLLHRVHDIAGVERIRFSSPHPRHVTPRLIRAIRDLPKIAKHLHLPVQSGSNRILTAMRRRYTRESYLDQISALREAVPLIAISTDTIVGFPGETDEDFALTMDLVQRAQYHAMYSFKYSPRPNTLAVKRMPDDVTEGEKTRRIVALQDLQRDIQGRVYANMVGRIETVLVDYPSRRRDWEVAGRTSGNTVVNFAGDASLVGRLVPVRITAASPNSLRGEAAGHVD
ncbi:MAG: tRNA (N6-isopentenyl adenosine(37)-C2)-methylthiotransferase MiaB [Acidobacteriota bacterium]